MAARGCYYPCYFAVGSVCRCPCGGANHNCGREGAPPQQAVVGGQMLASAPVSVELVPVETGEFDTLLGQMRQPGARADAYADWDTGGPPESDGWEASVTDEEQDRLDAVLAAQAANPAATYFARVGSVVTTRSPMHGTVNRVEEVTLDDGSTAYLKPVEQDDHWGCLRTYGVTVSEQATHEVAAYHLAAAMDDRYTRLVPVTVLVEDEEKGLSVLSGGRDGISGHAAQDELDNQDDWDDEDSWGANPADVRDGAFFDAVCGNADRHPGNFLVDLDGSVSLIDHGFAFRLPGGHQNAKVLQERRAGQMDGALTGHERATLTRLSESPNLLGVAPMIGAQRADAMRGRVEGMLRMDSVPA